MLIAHEALMAMQRPSMASFRGSKSLMKLCSFIARSKLGGFTEHLVRYDLEAAGDITNGGCPQVRKPT